jgi:ferredoxin
MHVSVDAGKCIASGQCVFNAPGVFDQREDEGTVLLLDDTPPPEHHAGVREAALVCPSGAITLKELRCGRTSGTSRLSRTRWWIATS